jgi:hypothetical protein
LIVIKKGGDIPFTVAALFLPKVNFDIPLVNPCRVYRHPAFGGPLGAHAGLEIKPPAMSSTNCSPFPGVAPVQQLALMRANVLYGPDLLPIAKNSYPPGANQDL